MRCSMTSTFQSAAIVLLTCAIAKGQGTAGVQGGSRPATLYEIERPWSYIGSPPRAGSAVGRVQDWARQSDRLNRTFETIKRSWTGQEIQNAEELRFRAAQYEDIIRMVTDAGGYGNLVLADSLRHMSLALLYRYVAT